MTRPPDPFWKTPDNARQYDEYTRTSFAGIYPVIAGQILERTGITRGFCLDIGTGPAPLAIALAMGSDLSIAALDNSFEIQSLALRNIRTHRLEHRVFPVLGDVHLIPFGDETCDLVVSRGSYHFWRDLPGAFREILRVLQLGGRGYIGGGYGSSQVKEEVLAGRKERGIRDDPDCPQRTRFKKFKPGEIEYSIETAGIRRYRIINDDSGFWMVFAK